jgi:hypothetical protein
VLEFWFEVAGMLFLIKGVFLLIDLENFDLIPLRRIGFRAGAIARENRHHDFDGNWKEVGVH